MPTNIMIQKSFIETMWQISIEEYLRTRIHPFITVCQSGHESSWGLSGLTVEAANLFGMVAGATWIKFHTGSLAAEKVAKWTSRGDGMAVVWKPTWEHSKLPPEKIIYWDLPGDVISKKSDGKGGTNLMVRRAFRAYTSWSESIQDWGKMISTNPRFTISKDDAGNAFKSPYDYAKEGDVAGYAVAVRRSKYASDPNYASKMTSLYLSIVNLLPPFDQALDSILT